MTEHMQHPLVPEPVLAPNQFELSVPRNAQGERIGTGAIVEPLRPGLPGETVRGAILKAIFRADRSMQALHGVAEQTVNRTGLSYVTGEERAQIEARKPQGTQVPAAEQRSGAQSAQLMEADKQQTERALDATRSALQSLAAAQAEPAGPQPQARNEGTTQPAEGSAQTEPESETEPVKFYSTKNGHELFTLRLPKGRKYTTTDVNRALKAAGYDFTYTPAWTPGGWRMRGRDIWSAFKKAVQAVAPPEAQAPGQKPA